MRFYIFVLIVGFVLLQQGAAIAHKVNIFVYVEDEAVMVEGYFVDGKKAKKSAVLVYDQSGAVIHKGKTNDLGVFSFKPSKKSDLRIVLKSGAGHQTEYTLHASELSGVEKNDVQSIEPMPSLEESLTETQGITGQPNNTATLDNEALKTLVKEAVTEASKPLARSLAEMKDRAGFTDIIGGIGYIVGILGIVFYFKSKKDDTSRS